jgi:hypothetical protein
VSARLPFAIFVSALLVCVGAFVRQRFLKPQVPLLTGRDRFALAIIVLMSGGWCSDIFFMKTAMENRALDFSSSWTMRLAK